MIYGNLLFQLIDFGQISQKVFSMTTKRVASILFLSLFGLYACNSGTSNSSSATTSESVAIVETVPEMTNIQLSPDATNPAVAIGQLINSATKSIDIEAFYFNNLAGTPFEQDIMQNLLNKANQGIPIRIVVESSMAASSLANGLNILESSPNVQIVFNNFFDNYNGGGIVHAKMVLVDNQSFFIGSQNFDWIAFELNHEVGGITTNSTLASQLAMVFNTDFNNGANYDPATAVPAMPNGNLFVATSPNYNGVPSEIDNIINLIDNATSYVDIQAMEIQNYNPYGNPPGYWFTLQDALTRAAMRGVQVRMMMSNWEFQEGQMMNYDNQFLLTMMKIPNVTIRYSTFPQTVGGVCVPYSAVDHAKFMVVDGKNVWIGTGNLAQSYFNNTRDYSIFVTNNPEFGLNVDNIFLKIWNSSYMTQFFSSVVTPVQPWCPGN
jgi:phosphatidylserine/phosphatidylglycerophosphate/cardiolipin synthase-like enzyme